MGYLDYVKSRLTPIGMFAACMFGALSIGHSPLSALIAALLSLCFFACVFTLLWLLGAVCRRKPRGQLARLGRPLREPLNLE